MTWQFTKHGYVMWHVTMKVPSKYPRQGASHYGTPIWQFLSSTTDETCALPNDNYIGMCNNGTNFTHKIRTTQSTQSRIRKNTKPAGVHERTLLILTIITVPRPLRCISRSGHGITQQWWRVRYSHTIDPHRMTAIRASLLQMRSLRTQTHVTPGRLAEYIAFCCFRIPVHTAVLIRQWS